MSPAATATATAVEVRALDVPVGDSMTMRVYETGELGMPVLLMLHGSGPGVSGISNWKELMLGLGDRYHCVAPDIIGFGDSTHPNPAPQGFVPNMDLRIEKLIAMLDVRGIDTINLVGNSMGGMFSLRMTQLMPDRIDRMVLMGSGGKPGMTPLPGLIKLVTFYDNPSVESMEELFLLFVSDKEAFGESIKEVAKSRFEIASREDIKRSHLGTFAPGPMWSLSEGDLAAITHKTLVVHGRNDVIVPIESSYYLAEHIPNADLYVINNCGHWTQVEQAERFKTILDDFMEDRI